MAHAGIPQNQVAQGPVLRPRLPLSVVTKPTGAACNLDCQYCFFLSKELLYTQSGDAVTSRSVSPLGYGRFLTAVFDEWVRQDIGRVFVQDLDAALSALFGIYPVCVHVPEYGVNLAMELNGDVYACDHWVEPDRRLGSVLDSSFAALAATPVMRRFSRKKRAELTMQCRQCPVVGLCHGGCPKDRFERSADGEDGHNYLCLGYQHFYRHILPDLQAMARLLRAGRAPAELMDPRTREQMRATGPANPAAEELSLIHI